MNEQGTPMEQRLFDYYDGRLGADESRDVQSWIEASDENRRTARRVYMLLLALDTRRVRQLTDTEGALKAVKSKGRIRPPRRTAGWWQWAQRVAAVLFLPMVLLAAWQYNRLQHDDTMAAADIEIRTNPGMTTRLTLPDHTQVWLNASSVLTYPARFAEGTRAVRLRGEAYFEVAKDPQSRFVVHTPGQSAVEVHGTRFNIEAYPDHPYVTTTLTEGSVSFLSPGEHETRRTRLEPGEKLIYDTDTRQLTRLATDGASELSWKDGLIIFDNTPLEEALHMLGKRFNVAFTVTNPDLTDDRFTGTFSDQQLEQILRFFKISTGIGWRYVDSPDPKQEKLKIEIY